MARGIGPGHTVTATGTITLAGSLMIDGSTGAYAPHGVGIIAAGADVTSDGMVTVQGGGPEVYTPQPIGGGTLAIYGTLANVGSLVLTGGQYGIQFSQSGGGGYVRDAGVLLNTGGVLVEAGGNLAGQLNDGRGGLLDVTGVLTNQATLTVQGSNYGYEKFQRDLSAGTLTNTGTIANNGVLVLAGGGVSDVATGKYGGGVRGGVGSRFLGSGTLLNFGTFVAEGGAGAYAVGDTGAAGGYAYLSGSVVNDGTMIFGGGAAGVETHKGGNFSVGGGYGARLDGAVDFTNVGVLMVEAGTATTSILDLPGLGAYARIGGYRGGGSFSNSGTVIVQGGAANPFREQNGLFYGGTFQIAASGTNTGVIEVQNGGFNQEYGGILSLTDAIDTYTTFVSSGTISIEVGASGGAGGQLRVENVFQLDGGSVLQSGVGSDPNMVLNYGTIIGFGTIDVSNLPSSGLIAAQGGLLVVDANIPALDFVQGRFAVDAGASLSLYGTIAAKASLSLSSTGRLIANAAAADLAISSPGGGTLTIVGGGTLSLGAKDSDLTVVLAAPTSLTLGQAGFLTAIGSSGADRIVAGAANQVLEGGGGGDTLTGYTGDGDTFEGTATQLNGATIGNFAGSDVIDLTDLMPGAGLKLSYTQQTGQGVLTVSEGTQTTSITLLGEFTQSQFSVTSDGASGVFIHP